MNHQNDYSYHDKILTTTSASLFSALVVLSLELEFEQLVEANLEKEVQAREIIEYKHHDIELMKQRCEYELASMRKNGEVAAPYFFERVAILSRKLKNYEQEVLYCEMYISELDRFYAEKGTEDRVDVRNGSRYQAIVNRLPKAKTLLAKANA